MSGISGDVTNSSGPILCFKKQGYCYYTFPVLIQDS